MKHLPHSINALFIAILFSLFAVPAFAGNGYGPGDCTGTGDQLEDGDGMGPGDRTISLIHLQDTTRLLAIDGTKDCDQDQTQDQDKDQDQDQDQDQDKDQDKNCIG